MMKPDQVNDFIRWAKAELITLSEDLISIGYEFAAPAGPLVLADESDLTIIEEKERFLGRFPLLIKTWYQNFRVVDFRQSGFQLCHAGSAVSGLGYNCPLVFLSLSEESVSRAELSDRGFRVQEGSVTLIPTGDFATNCEPKGFWVPDDSVDPELYDEGAGPVTFGHELVRIIRARGFPFWEHAFRRRRHFSPIGFSPDYPGVLTKLSGFNPPPFDVG